MQPLGRFLRRHAITEGRGFAVAEHYPVCAECGTPAPCAAHPHAPLEVGPWR